MDVSVGGFSYETESSIAVAESGTVLGAWSVVDPSQIAIAYQFSKNRGDAWIDRTEPAR